MTITLVLGGARSGKSALAESLAEKTDKNLLYIATATADDEAMGKRIQTHQAQRSDRWQLQEEPLYLANILQQYDQPNSCLLIDCLTLWLTNLLMHADKDLPDVELNKLKAILPTLEADIIMVSNEVGLGIIPMGDLTRQFCDEAGRLHQAIAKLSDNVVFTIAGLPQYLKGSPAKLG